MHNPNPEYIFDQSDADDFDAEQFLAHVCDVLDARRTRILAWFESKGFTVVRVREVSSRGKDAYEVLAISNADHQCRTDDDVFRLLNRLASDMRKSVSREEFCGIVWQDRVGTQFRLR